MIQNIRDLKPLQPLFLEGDFGREFLQTYRRRVKTDYQGNSVLSDLARVDEVFEDHGDGWLYSIYFSEDMAVITERERQYYPSDLVIRSNPFSTVLTDQILIEEGLSCRVSTQSDLERFMRFGNAGPKVDKTDSFLALRTEEGPNKYLAKHLMEQLKFRDRQIKLPVMIPLRGLNVVNEGNSPFGLAFQLTEESEITYNPLLLQENWGKGFSEVGFEGEALHFIKRFSNMDESGRPIPDKEGTRRWICMESKGLGAYELDNDGGKGCYSDSDSENFSITGKRCRIVLSDPFQENLNQLPN